MTLSLDRVQSFWEKYYHPYYKWPRFQLGVMDMTLPIWPHYFPFILFKDAPEIAKLCSPPYNYGNLQIAVWLYALQEKKDAEDACRVKGKSAGVYDYPPMVNVCLSIVNPLFFSFNKADYKYNITRFSQLLQAESLNRIGAEIGKKPKPPIPCPDYHRCLSKNRDKYDEYLKKSVQQPVQTKNSPPSCRNKVGNCAEQRAANELLIHPNIGKITLPSLKFSLAIRPRTMQIHPYCCNCYTLFPQLK